MPVGHKVVLFTGLPYKSCPMSKACVVKVLLKRDGRQYELAAVVFVYFFFLLRRRRHNRVDYWLPDGTSFKRKADKPLLFSSVRSSDSLCDLYARGPDKLCAADYSH